MLALLTLALVILYVYFGYPLLLGVLASIRRKPVKKAQITPNVSLLIAAYNEEKVIREKIENSLQLDYPENKLEVIVASDGSTDETNEIVSKFVNEGVRIVYDPINRGKSFIQNKAIKEAKGDIVVFSDATGLYNREAIKALIKNFGDNNVGCVAGVLKDTKVSTTSISEANSFYWKYETFLRRKESKIGILAMASGSIFAIRRKLFVPLDPAVGDDFVIPMNVIQQGYRVVYEPEAISEEEIASQVKSKLKQKVRVITKDLRGLFYKKELLNPFKYPLVSLGLISHKLLRWSVPLFLICIFVLNIFLLNLSFYQITFGIQILFYSMACVGGLLYFKDIRVKLFYLPFYFCLLNFAALVGIFNFILGRKMGKWKPER